MSDWMLISASVAVALLIAYSELAAVNKEIPANAGSTVTERKVPATATNPGAVAGNGANDQAIGAMGQAGLSGDR